MTEPVQATQAAEAPNPHAAISVTTQRDDLVAAANAVEVPATEDVPVAPAENDVVEPADAANDNGEPDQPTTVVTPTAPTLGQRLAAAKEKEKLRLAQKTAGREVLERVSREQAELAHARIQVESERRAIEAERARLQQVQKDPLKLAEFAGISREQLAQNLVMAGSPEWEANQRLISKLEALEAQQNEQRTAWDAHQAQLQKQQQAYAQQQQAALEHSYVSHTSDAGKYPTLSRLSERQRLILGYEVQREYHSKTKDVATDDMIAEYLESSLSGNQADAGSGNRQPANGGHGKAPTSRANGPRTLSNTVASESRSSRKPVNNNLSADELRAEMIAAAKEAKATSP